MARKRAMSQREVDALKTPGMTCVSDNLYLQIRDGGTRSWLYRYWVEGKPKVIGLGAARDFTLAEEEAQQVTELGVAGLQNPADFFDEGDDSVKKLDKLQPVRVIGRLQRGDSMGIMFSDCELVS